MSSEWSVVYEKSIRDDGTLLFPERLSAKFLEKSRKSMGSYLFANQYQNEVIPEDEKRFKSNWLRYYVQVPQNTYRFGFIDPAIGQDKHHDYTGIVVVDVDSDGVWYVRMALRERLDPSQIVSKMFEIHKEFKLQALGVEIVAYQEALIYMLAEEMRRRQETIPVQGIKRAGISKQTRILGLVPRFEWGRLYLARGLTHLEDEYSRFPRGKHDDLLDALASLEELVFYPQKPREDDAKELPPNHPQYESQVIRNLYKNANKTQEWEE